MPAGAFPPNILTPSISLWSASGRRNTFLISTQWTFVLIQTYWCSCFSFSLYLLKTKNCAKVRARGKDHTRWNLRPGYLLQLDLKKNKKKQNQNPKQGVIVSYSSVLCRLKAELPSGCLAVPLSSRPRVQMLDSHQLASELWSHVPWLKKNENFRHIGSLIHIEGRQTVFKQGGF